MTCRKCGAILKENSKFCTYCGQKSPGILSPEEASKKILRWGFWVNVVELVGVFGMIVIQLALPRIVQNLDIPLHVVPRTVLPLVIHAAATAVLLLLLGSGAFVLPEKSGARWKLQGVLFIGYALFQGYYFVIRLRGVIKMLSASTAALWQRDWQFMISDLLWDVNEFLLFFLLLAMGISFLCKKAVLPNRVVPYSIAVSAGLSVLSNLITFITATSGQDANIAVLRSGIHFNYGNLISTVFTLITIISLLVLYSLPFEPWREGTEKAAAE